MLGIAASSVLRGESRLSVDGRSLAGLLRADAHVFVCSPTTEVPMTTSESRISVSRLPGALRAAASSGAHQLQARSTSRATIARLRRASSPRSSRRALAVLVPRHAWPGPGNQSFAVLGRDPRHRQLRGGRGRSHRERQSDRCERLLHRDDCDEWRPPRRRHSRGVPLLGGNHRCVDPVAGRRCEVSRGRCRYRRPTGRERGRPRT